MRANLNYIKIIVLLLVVVSLFAFSNHRNVKRKVAEPQVEFLGENHPFITHSTVSKLLIQNQQSITDKPKETLDLEQLESALNANPMIKSAEVHMSVNGVLTAEIEQKRPIARVSTNAAYYIDDSGSYMPLSNNYSARVPLVTGVVRKNKLTNIYQIASLIDSDEFLKTHVTSIHQNADQSIELSVRGNDFKIELGNLQYLDKKINNLKAFYKIAIKDKTLDSYSNINLKFGSQVICTKK